MTTEYARYLKRLNDIVYMEVVPKLALFDFFTKHAFTREPNPVSKEPLIWYIQSGLMSDITFSLHRLVDTGGKNQNKPSRNIRHFLNYTRDNLSAILWKTPLMLTDIHRHKTSLKAVEPQIDRLSNRRNKFFGHYDDEFFFDPKKLDIEFPFSNEDAKTLVRTFQCILSDYNLALTGTASISIEDFVYVGAERLFERILNLRKD